MTGYYDALLVLLPVSLFGLSGGLHAAGVALVPSLTLGALVAAGLTAHGLFVNDPVSSQTTPPERSDAAFESAD
ncbi:MAG: hypothetical protein ABEH83_01605 [Halobacterium sp.]